MPNYNDRQYNAEEARRQINRMAQGEVGPRQLAQMAQLAQIADALENQNDRVNSEYRKRENPGPYNPQDYPRNEYVGRRRDERGRFMDYDDNVRNYHEPYSTPESVRRYEYDQRQVSNFIPYYPYYPIRYNTNREDHESKPKIGFGSPYENSNRSGKNQKFFDTLEEYYEDFEKHSKSQTPTEREHAKLELQELMVYMCELYEWINKMAMTSEEKQILQQYKQKIAQMQ